MTSQSGVDTEPGMGNTTLGSARTRAAAASRPPDADSDIDDPFLVGVAAAPSIDPDVPTMLMPGAHVVGKYRIEARIGQGGMGTVYKATDTRLQRPVAIKIHHALGTRVERLRREARLLARLSHPNVVTVLEVGTHDGMLFVAMEYVDGGSARAWLRARPRTWQEIVALYREAGRGLTAAHALGIVHRDFKPDNVLVGSDGRPRVADFGLAGSAADVQLEADATIEAMAGTQPTDSSAFATEAGVMVGTPAYVAPEQIGSSRVDVRADQFGFCAALFEAIYGELPFPGRSVQEIVGRIGRGDLVRPTKLERAPAWVLAVLERGLARDPAARFPDMNALLAALARPPRVRRFGPVLALGGVLAIMGAAFMQTTQPTPDLCADESPAAGWERARQDIRAHVEARREPTTVDAWAHFDGRIGGHANRWATTRDDVCEAAATDASEADAARRARELACLADGAREIDRLLAELAEPTTMALTRATEVTEHLADPERCIGAVPSVVAPPPDAIAYDVERVRSVVDTAATRLRLGRASEANALAEVVVVRAQQLAYSPLLAEALLVRASSRATLGDLAAAREDAIAAYEEARRGGDELTVARTADIRGKLALDHGDLDEALRWTTEARASLTRPTQYARLFVGMVTREAEIRAQRDELDAAHVLTEQAARFVEEVGDDDELRAMVEKNRGEIAQIQGDYGTAVAGFERAREASQSAFGPWHYSVAYLWHEQAVTYVFAGNYVEARNAYAHSLEIFERVGDAPVLQLVGIKLGLASCEDMLGNGDAALRLIAEAESLYRAAGHANPLMGQVLHETRGVTLLGLGRGAEALASLQQALPAAELRWGEAHSELRMLLANLALAAREAGRSELAESYLQRALRIQSSLAQDDETGAELLHAYGFLLLERGQLDAAAEQFERSGNVLEQVVGIDSPEMGWVELGRGRIALLRRNYELARLSLERADALWSGDEIPPEDRADLQRDLAEALWETGDRARALAVARAAAEVRPDDEKLREWLAAHHRK